MARKETPWKLDRPYDPDERAAALRRRFSNYLDRNGVRAASSGSRFFMIWLLIAVGAVAVFLIGH